MRFNESTIIRCPCCKQLIKVDFEINAGHTPLSVKAELCYPEFCDSLSETVTEEITK